MEYDKRIIIYPAYLNKKLTKKYGRRVPVQKACDDPLPNEICDVCIYLKLPAEIEIRKSYSRQWWVFGRVRIKLFNENGKPNNPLFPTRFDLMRKIGELIPKHPGRQIQAAPKPVPQSKPTKKGKKGKK